MKPRRELKVGDKIRFSGPASGIDNLYEHKIALIVGISSHSLNLKIQFDVDNKTYQSWISRRQVVSVFVKKKKESKYPKEIWVNIYSTKDMQAHINEEIADLLCSETRLQGKAIRYVLAKGQ